MKRIIIIPEKNNENKEENKMKINGNELVSILFGVFVLTQGYYMWASLFFILGISIIIIQNKTKENTRKEK